MKGIQRNSKAWKIRNLADGSRTIAQLAAAAGCDETMVAVTCARHKLPIADYVPKSLSSIECPGCSGTASAVIDSRPSGSPLSHHYSPASIRRRRTCLNCGTRFNTYEIRDMDLRNLLSKADDPNRRAVIKIMRDLADEIEEELNARRQN